MEGQYSTVQAARKLGLSMMTVHRYIVAKKIPVPPMQKVGNVRVRLWTDKEIERVRALLPKITNGRKTRYEKKQSALSTQRSAKPKPKTRKKPEVGSQKSVGPKSKPGTKKKPPPKKAVLNKKGH